MRLASFWIAGFAFLLALSACKKSGSGALEADTNNSSALFAAVPEEKTGIRFVNELSLSGEFDVFRYRNYYNGGGVAIGDINNDGRPDVFLTSNQGENRLFLNKGNFTFEDITAKAGVAGTAGGAPGGRRGRAPGAAARRRALDALRDHLLPAAVVTKFPARREGELRQAAVEGEHRSGEVIDGRAASTARQLVDRRFDRFEVVAIGAAEEIAGRDHDGLRSWGWIDSIAARSAS